MPTIQVEAQVSRQDLLKAAEQLGPPEFQQFVTDVLALRAQRQAPQLSGKETELMLRINQGLPEPLRSRYQELAERRGEETLTAEEHAELLRLGDEVERLEVRRLEALAELAQLRGCYLAQVMKQLGIQAPNHD